MNKVKLSDVMVRANTKVDKDNTNLVYYVGGEHFISGEFTVEQRGLIAGSTIGPMFYYGFKAGHFLLVSRNPHLKKAGIVDFDGICSEKTFVLQTANPSVLLPEYLPFVLQNEVFWEYAIAHKHGSTNFFINWNTLANYEFYLPTVDTQRRIAKTAWAAHRVKKAYESLLKSIDNLVESQFVAMFGDPIRNDRAWNTFRFPEVTEIILGSTPRTNRSEYWDGELKWITPAEISDDSFYIDDTVKHITELGVKETGLKSFPAGTVIFSTRAPIGKTAIAACEMYCNQGFKNFVCGPKLRPVYLYYLLKNKRDYFVGLGSGTTFKELSRSAIEKISIAVPPIDLQKQFEELFVQSNKSKIELQKAIQRIDNLIKSVISQE